MKSLKENHMRGNKQNTKQPKQETKDDSASSKVTKQLIDKYKK